MPLSITISVSYAQFAVFDSALQQPFNEWTKKHVDQGFSWRPGRVSFRTLVEAAPHKMSVEVVEHASQLGAEVVQAIEVPFVVPANGSIEVGSISHTVPLSISSGNYLLRCEFLPIRHENEERVRLLFARKNKPHFAVVRSDEMLSLDGSLLTTAQAAY